MQYMVRADTPGITGEHSENWYRLYDDGRITNETAKCRVGETQKGLLGLLELIAHYLRGRVLEVLEVYPQDLGQYNLKSIAVHGLTEENTKEDLR